MPRLRFKKSRKGILAMLLDAKPLSKKRASGKLDLPAFFQKCYQINKARGKRPKKIEILFPDKESATRFGLMCQEMAAKHRR